MTLGRSHLYFRPSRRNNKIGDIIAGAPLASERHNQLPSLLQRKRQTVCLVSLLDLMTHLPSKPEETLLSTMVSTTGRAQTTNIEDLHVQPASLMSGDTRTAEAREEARGTITEHRRTTVERA